MLKKKQQKLRKPKRNAFTLIEIIIVLAIVGVIFSIIFIGVPELQRSVRDHHRKTYARDVLGAVIEYYKNNGKLPLCTPQHGDCATAYSEAANFMTAYMPIGRDPSTGQDWNSTTAVPKNTAFCSNAPGTPSGSAMYCQNDNNGGWIEHNIKPDVGQLIIVANHFCCPCAPAENPFSFAGDTITHGTVENGDWDRPDTVSILVYQERGDYYCIDNYAPK